MKLNLLKLKQVLKQQIELVEQELDQEQTDITELQTLVQSAHHAAQLTPPSFNQKVTELEQQIASPNSVNTSNVKQTLDQMNTLLQTGKILLWLEY